MTAPSRPTFAHRNNSDGTTDSICRQCFATVYTSVWEADLERAERDHACDPEVLRQWDKFAKPPPQRTKDPAP